MGTLDKNTDDAHKWQAVEEAAELVAEERFVEALVALRDVIKADMKNPYAYFFLGTALYETGQRETARDAYRAAIRISPSYLGARVALSHVLRQLGDVDGALSQANEARRRFPEDGDAMHAAGLAYAAKGDRRAARKQLEGYLSTNPEVETQLEVKQILGMLGIGSEGEPVEFD